MLFVTEFRLIRIQLTKIAFLSIIDLRPLDHDKGQARSSTRADAKTKSHSSNDSTSVNTEKPAQKMYKNLKNILLASMLSNYQSVLSKLEAAEELGDCVIDFEI